MTIQDKRNALGKFCRAHTDCTDCPCEGLYDPFAWCATHNYNNIPEDLLDATLRKYNIVDIPAEVTEVPETPNSNVDHPSHYNQGGIECIDAMLAAFGKEAVENFCLLNALKYVWRTQDKNGLEDVDKAIWYLTKYKELVNNG